MADINKRLLTASDGIPAPQHKVKGESDFEFTEGSGGAQHTKIVDSSGQPINIDDELKSIKRTQAEILDRLDKGIDTRLTGSNVEVFDEGDLNITSGAYSSSLSVYFTNKPYRGYAIQAYSSDKFELQIAYVIRDPFGFTKKYTTQSESDLGRLNTDMMNIESEGIYIRFRSKSSEDINVTYQVVGVK